MEEGRVGRHFPNGASGGGGDKDEASEESEGKETRQEEGDERDQHEQKEVRNQEEEEDVWNRKANGEAIDWEKKIICLLKFKRTTYQRADFEGKATGSS